MLIGSASLAMGPLMVRLADVGPTASGFWRMALAAPVLLLVCRFGGQTTGRIDRRILVPILLAGLLFASDLAAWHAGIVRTTLANSVLFGNTTSFAFAAYGFIVARRLPGRNALLALLLAAAGVILLMGRSYELSPDHFIGDLLCLLAALFYTLYLIAIGHARGVLKPLPTLALVTSVGAAFMLIFVGLSGETIWPTDWTPLVVLALSSQILGQGLIIFALPHLAPMTAGLCLLIQPVIAAAIGWTMFDERLGALDFVGAGMILVALILVRAPDKSAPAG